MFTFLFILVAALLVYVFKGIIIVQQQEEVIIQRLGRYEKTLNAGLNFIFPVLDTPRAITKRYSQKGMDGHAYYFSKQSDRIDLRESVYDFPRQNVITKDNVSITINALLYFQIVDAKSAVYEIENLPEAIEKLTQTTLRNLVGQLELQETLVSRDKINNELRTILDDATNKWGVKVNRVELQDIITPVDIQNAMDKQMKAEREKRATILEAEGLKEAAIKKAEGQKAAAILTAEGVAQARVIEADAEKEAIGRVIEALAKNGQPDKYLIAMKYLEALKSITAGQNNKIVYMPYEATGILSSVDGIKEMFNAKTGSN
ncbi:MAG: SPFH/Band 7/PHB domain protein [Heliobacteriaceae bacterium]|jgi:regulator of protease activity HflC (stomatin/prohibitin superfamily)|nr:SPFH/Band 7/PHB domain protein [Heliobacteriaceae bacterium]